MNRLITDNRTDLSSRIKRCIAVLAVLCGLVFSVSAQNKGENSAKSLLILHTNDIHDHLRPDYDGAGGLPYVSGYIRDTRSQRKDVIVLDAGDFAEKGDWMARKTGSELTFKAVSRIGYDAWAPGNHDHDFGMKALHKFNELSGTEMLCINLLKKDGTPEFKPSKIFEINGLRVGVVGAIRPRDQRSLNLEETAEAMNGEAKRLKEQTDVIIAVVHISSKRSAFISKMAPDIDVFISGHTHEALHEAKIVPETSAIIVQAGSYADYVGRLQLDIDDNKRIILSYDYQLVAMDHLKIPPDVEMMEWFREKEMALVPEARQIVSWSPREINYAEVGYLAAEALRKATEADIAFNHSAEIIRSKLPAGLIDLNAIYRTGGERGRRLLTFELLGSEIQSYLQGMKMSEWFRTQWSGFHGRFENDTFITNLEPEKKYHVVMPEREFHKRFQRLFKRVEENPEEWPGVTPLRSTLNPVLLKITWTEAMKILLEEWNRKNLKLNEQIQRIIKETGQNMHLVLNDRYR